jgi:uncharacterized protein (DUF2336 family)
MMPQTQDKIPQLFALARDKSDAGRLRLAEKLADFFLNDDVALTANESDQLSLLIDELLATQDPIVRGELTQRFAHAAKLSRPLAVRVAFETAEIARDVLIGNQQLTNDDLIAIVETKGRDHARLIAQRSEIAEAVTDALLTTGDLQVMQTVAENLGAKLSAKAVRFLSEAARLTVSLQEPIARRPELTEDQALRLYWWVAEDLRAKLMERFGIGNGRIEDGLQKALDEKLDACLLQKNDDAQMKDVADWMGSRGAISVKILPQVLRMGHFRLFNILLARLSGLKIEVVDMVTNESGGRTLATLCRAIGVDKAHFVSVFLLARAARPGEHIVHPRELSFALASFDRLTLEEALTTIHTWRVKTAEAAMRSEEARVAKA